MYTARVAPVFLILLLLGGSGPSGPEGPNLHPNFPTRSGSEMTLTVAGDNEGDEGAPVGFAVSAEAAPGEIVTYDWDFGDGTEGISNTEETSVEHRFARDSVYTVTVSASGDMGYSAEAEMEVVIHNVAPEVRWILDDGERLVDRTIHFVAQVDDPGDDDLTYEWDFGDGTAPLRGPDLETVSHVYTRAGSYRVTLRVEDEADDENSGVGIATVELEIRQAFQADVQGTSIQRDLSGITTATPSMLGGGGTNQIPFGPEAQRTCLIGISAWDDASRSMMMFSGAVSRPYRTGTYRVSREDGPFTAQMMIGMPEEAYASAKAIFQEGGEGMDLMAMAARAAAAARSGDPGAAAAMAGMFGAGLAGDVDPYHSVGGELEITRFEEDRIDADFSISFAAAEDPDRTAVARGGLTWLMSPAAQRRQMLFCGREPFDLESHRPEPEEVNVDFEAPVIAVEFTVPYDTASVRSGFRVGWVDEAGDLHPVAGQISHAPDQRTLHFVPDEPLWSAIYYKGVIRGGETGVRSTNGQTLPEDYEWRFATVVDLVPRSGSGGGTGGRDPVPPTDEPVHHTDRRTSGPSAPGFLPGDGAGPSRGGSPRASLGPSPYQDVPGGVTFDCNFYQTSMNARLVPGRPAMIRVNAIWPVTAGVASNMAVTQFPFDVRAVVDGRTLTARQTFYRDDGLPPPAALARAEHTAELYGWTPSASGGNAQAAVRVTTTSPSTGKVYRYPATCAPVGLWDQAPVLKIKPWYLLVDSWAGSAPTAKAEAQRQAGALREFGVQTLPVKDIQIEPALPLYILDPGDLVEQEDPQDPGVMLRSYRLGPIVPLMGRKMEYWLDCAGVNVDDRNALVRTSTYFAAYLQDEGIGGDPDRIDVVVLPYGLLDSDIAGTNIHPPQHHIFDVVYETCGKTVLFLQSGQGAGTAVHELMHYLARKLGRPSEATPGSNHCPGPAPRYPGCRGTADVVLNLRGFKLAFPRGEKGWNKDMYEGNGEHPNDPPNLARRVLRASAVTLRNIMEPGGISTDRHFQLNGVYDALFDLVAEQAEGGEPVPEEDASAELAISGTTAPAPRTGSGPTLGLAGNRSGFGRSYAPPSYLPPPAHTAIEVEVLHPSPGSTLSGVDSLVWEVTGTAAAAFVEIQYRTAPSEPWAPIAFDLGAGSRVLDTALLPPGSGPEFRILVEAGEEAAEATVGVRLDNPLTPGPRRPAPGDSVPVDASVTVSFASTDPVRVDPSSFFLTDTGGARIPASVTYDEEYELAVLDPDEPLVDGATYTATLTTEARDAAGRGPSQDVSWSFHTLPDVVPPWVERVTPADGGLTIPVDTPVRLTFSEPMDPASLTPASVRLVSAAGTSIPLELDYDGDANELVATPREELALSTVYTLTVSDGAHDVAGNALYRPFVSGFKTVGRVGRGGG